LSRFWNWKSACLSALLRSPIFLAAGLQSGVHAAATAGLTDAMFRLVVAGWIGAAIQRLAGVRPLWASTAAVVVGVPLFAHSAEALVHWEAATPHWVDAFRVSVVVSIVSALFNLYAMRRGVLLAGKGAQSLFDDFRQMPTLIVGFLLLPVRQPERAHAVGPRFGKRPDDGPDASGKVGPPHGDGVPVRAGIEDDL